MTKSLKVKYQKQCIGCELCVFEVQRQLKKVGLDGALIRIIKNKPAEDKKLEFYVELDPQVNHLDIERVLKICPTNVYEIVETQDNATEFSL